MTAEALPKTNDSRGIRITTLSLSVSLSMYIYADDD